MADKQFKAILFSGGSGSRLWPMSRRARPKQFQPLIGRDSLFQLMVRRLERLIGIQNVFVSTGLVYRDMVLEQVPNLPPDNVLAEPEMRDTLAAVGYAVAVLNDRFPGSTIATLWGADHIVRRDDEFIACLKAAHELAGERNWVVKVDVRPTSPSSALGYIEYGQRLDSAGDRPVYAFKRQIEKPSLEVARELVAAGNYLWNTGYIVWKAATILDLYRQHAPEAFGLLQDIVSALHGPSPDVVVPELYSRLPKLSIDKGIFEKMSGDNMVVMPAELGWSDVGAWDVLRDELADPASGNAVRAEHRSISTRNCLIFGPEGKPVVTIGIEDLIIVDTGDALLVCSASSSQELKKVVQKLEEELPELL